MNIYSLLILALSPTATAYIATPLQPKEVSSLQRVNSCSKIWEQCGGKDWKGPVCCDEGLSCILSNEWYSQCQNSPSSTQSATSTTSSTSPPPPQTATASSTSSLETATSTIIAPPPNPTATLLSASQMKSFASTNGSTLLLDGKPFYYASTNSYSLFYLPRKEVDSFFASAVALKNSVIRTWLFCDGKTFPGGHTNIGGNIVYFWEIGADGTLQLNLDPVTGIPAFDYVIASAKAHGIKLLLTLSNNWNDFGGIDVYNDRFSKSSPTYHSDFFGKPEVKKEFKRYISALFSRVNGITGVKYGEDPTILAWELINESRCTGNNPQGKFPDDPACSTAMITSWVDEMTTHIKSINNLQLTAIGDEGFFGDGKYPSNYPGAYSNIYDGSSGCDFSVNAGLKNVDLLGIHSYFDAWGTSSDPLFLQNTVQWIKDHAKVARKVNKPLYLGEYGTTDQAQKLKDSPLIQQTVEEEGLVGSHTWIMLSDAFGGKCQQGQYSGYTYCVDDPNINTIIYNHASRMFAKSL